MENASGIPEIPISKEPETGFLYSLASLGAYTARLAKYTVVKGITLLGSLAIGLYLTILIINLGGYVDRIFEAQIDEQIGGMILGGWLKEVTDEVERNRIIDETRFAMQRAKGLHEPFLSRTFYWLWQSMSLDVGRAYSRPQVLIESANVRNIVLERLPFTLALSGLANLFVLIASVALALALSRKPGSFFDRLAVLLSPLTSAPSWIFGVFLILVFAGMLNWFPFPRNLKTGGNIFSPDILIVYLRHIALPALAVILSMLFQSIYAWRTFFLIYSQEDYVDVARAKGLSNRVIESRYILRPAMPFVITSFGMMMVSFWQSSIALEQLFLWPGIGAIFIPAVNSHNTPLVLGIVVVFAYLLTLTVFILDFLYAMIDPRVKIGGQDQSLRRPIESGRRLRDFFKQIFAGKWSGRPTQGFPTAVSTTGWNEPLTSQPPIHQARRPSPGQVVSNWSQELRRLIAAGLISMRPIAMEIRRYPSALFGLAIILVLTGVSIYTIIAIPYDQAVILWRAQGGDWYRMTWYQNPRLAQPEWFNLFRRQKLPKTIILHSQDVADQQRKPISEEITQLEIPFTFEFSADEEPQDLVIYFLSRYEKKQPYVTFTWLTPDGRKLDLGGFAITSSNQTYYLSRDERLQKKLKNPDIVSVLFNDTGVASGNTIKGTYTLLLSILFFEPNGELEAETILYGRVSGWAGTDTNRRDLGLALLWGAPVALAFGLLGAVGTNLLAMLLAAISAWFSGWVDSLIQRISEINLIMPTLPIAVMVFMLYSKSIWAVLGVIVLLNIFGSAIKNYRAVFLQARQDPYIEAALSYGASNRRIIGQYLIPRILPVLFPQLVIMAPGYVFYEATLAYLGVSDPYLPTWGKVIYEAIASRALLDPTNYYWILLPLALLVITGLAFAMLGFAMDRVLNPRLRDS
jgi:peptide/nickel transport system permease protein